MKIKELKTGDIIQDDNVDDYGIFIAKRDNGGNIKGWAMFFDERDYKKPYDGDPHSAVCSFHIIKTYWPFSKMNRLEQIKIICTLKKHKVAIDDRIGELTFNIPK